MIFIWKKMQKRQTSFLSKIQNRISEKTGKKILLLYGKISKLLKFESSESYKFIEKFNRSFTSFRWCFECGFKWVSNQFSSLSKNSLPSCHISTNYGCWKGNAWRLGSVNETIPFLKLSKNQNNLWRHRFSQNTNKLFF